MNVHDFVFFYFAPLAAGLAALGLLHRAITYRLAPGARSLASAALLPFAALGVLSTGLVIALMLMPRLSES